jgi:hypothetical protein
MGAGRTISFRDNVAHRHGDVYRSSAIFYVPPTDGVQTTISFLNYWALKRDLQVAVLASVRTMAGELVGRERLRFEAGMVINYRPPVERGFEGSVEIEVLSIENMAIPYAAVIAWYESGLGTTLVHSYARAYSPHEVEEGRTVTRGREGCWTVGDDARTRSFCVFHNGLATVPAQQIRLGVRNATGDYREVHSELPALRPFETIRMEPGLLIDGFEDFLGGQPGQAELDFELGGGFTRMLVGNQRHDGSDLQVTHSNFNYAIQATDMAGADACGWMEVPAALREQHAEVLVYPQSVPGRYRVRGPGLEHSFTSGSQVLLAPTVPSTLEFSVTQGEFPTRLVTALRVDGGQGRLVNECSLGVITKLQPPKRLWWGPLRCDAAQSQLVVHDLMPVYGGIPADAPIALRLFSAAHPEPLERTLPSGALPSLGKGMAVDELWPQARTFLGGEPGYYTMYCPYGGLTAYTLTSNAHGSVSLEHGF